MKKIIIVSLFLVFMVSSGFAIQSGLLPTGVGAKYAAMGGAGASIVDDITSAYFNPAGIMRSGRMELKLGAGVATEGMNDVISALGSAGDPAKFLSDNFNKTINVNGGLNSIIGINVAKVGVSVIPVASLQLVKPTAGTLIGTSFNASAAYEGILTLGYRLSVPGLPIASLDLGTNIKSGNLIYGTSNITGATNSIDSIYNYSGVGIDIGAIASLNTPVVPVSVGIVIKDISETFKGKVKGQTTVYDPITGKATVTPIGEVDAADITMPSTTVIGASTVIPGVGLKVAVDLDSVASSSSYGNAAYSLTHIGVEYPVLGIVALRAGTVSGGPSGGEISQTTFGAGFNLGAVINVAMMSDAKNSKNNSTMVDLGFAF